MSTKEAVFDTGAMISGMSPALDPEIYVFCTTADPAIAARGKSDALSWFEEAEGTSLIIGRRHAEAIGMEISTPMSRIELRIFSSLDGVGLTAAVASALAANGIACNMVAAYHHDHVFVPADRAREAMEILEALASSD